MATKVVVPDLPRSSTAVSLATRPKATLPIIFFFSQVIPFHFPGACWRMESRVICILISTLGFVFIFSYFCKIHVFCTRLSEFAGNIDRGFLIGQYHFILAKQRNVQRIWFQPRRNIWSCSLIVRVTVVPRTVLCSSDWSIDNLSESHRQIQIWSLYSDDDFSPAQDYCHSDDSNTRSN